MDIPTTLRERLGAGVKSGAPRNEREEMIEKFRSRLNLSRAGTKFKLLPHTFVAVKLQGIPTGDLHAVFQKCETYREFGAGFFYELKPKAA